MSGGPTAPFNGDGEESRRLAHASSSDAELAKAWTAEKEAHPDLTEAEKAAFEAARDSVKQLLALATGIIALTITFAKDYVTSVDVGRWIALFAWGSFLFSAFAGLWALNALTGAAGALKPKTWLSIRSFNISFPGTLQVSAFIAGLILTVVYAAKATSKNTQQQLADEVFRRPAVRALIEEQLYWTISDRVVQANAQLDSSGATFVRRMATVAAARIDYRSASDSAWSLQRAAERVADEAVRNARAAIPDGQARAPTHTVVGARNVSRVLRLCPLYPFC